MDNEKDDNDLQFDEKFHAHERAFLHEMREKANQAQDFRGEAKLEAHPTTTKQC